MGNVYFGMIEGLHVSDVIQPALDALSTCAGGIIRSIDSAHEPGELARIVRRRGLEPLVVAGNILLPRTALYAAVAAGIFSGFDEVWFVSTLTPRTGLKDVAFATSDGTSFTAGLPAGLLDAMGATECSLVVGDGCGLNYATTNEQVAAEIGRL